MTKSLISECRSYGWLDSLAVSMAMVCAVHCLLTPVLVVMLPLLATTFWVHEDFHLWMILFVVPTTCAAVFMGCRKHKDTAVLVLSMTGLLFLVSIAVYETVFHAGVMLQENGACTQCASCDSASVLNPTTIVNILGGALLASAHIRNFFLCRKSNCTHDP